TTSTARPRHTWLRWRRRSEARRFGTRSWERWPRPPPRSGSRRKARRRRRSRGSSTRSGLAANATRAKLRAESLAVARSLPAGFWLASLVVASVIVRWGFGRRMVAPWIMVDELVYSELAKSFAATGHFLVRDHPSGSYGFVYPILISPAYRLYASVPQAYAAAKTINSVLMSLTAVPAYFLARRVVAPALALFAALPAAATPSTPSPGP